MYVCRLHTAIYIHINVCINMHTHGSVCSHVEEPDSARPDQPCLVWQGQLHRWLELESEFDKVSYECLDVQLFLSCVRVYIHVYMYLYVYIHM